MDWAVIKARWWRSLTVWWGGLLAVGGIVLDLAPTVMELIGMPEMKSMLPPSWIAPYTTFLGLCTIAARARTLIRVVK